MKRYRAFSINISTSKKNINEAIKAVELCINKLKSHNWIENDSLEKVRKRLILKEGLALKIYRAM